MLKKKPTLAQLRKYDVSQKILEILANAQSRVILFSMIKDGKTAVDLSAEHRIPLSSVYQKISELEDLSMIRVERTTISDSGKKFKIYKSRISKADVSYGRPKPIISLHPN